MCTTYIIEQRHNPLIAAPATSSRERLIPNTKEHFQQKRFCELPKHFGLCFALMPDVKPVTVALLFDQCCFKHISSDCKKGAISKDWKKENFVKKLMGDLHLMDLSHKWQYPTSCAQMNGVKGRRLQDFISGGNSS